MFQTTLIRMLPFGLLAVLVACNEDKVHRLEKENQELAAKLDAVTKTANLESQKKCADQAAVAFRESGFAKKSMAGYVNHYQQKLNKCFVHISNTDFENNVLVVYQNVSDAFESKLYGEYMWRNPERKKYSEVKPILCTVTLLSGEEKLCHSQEEFNELVKIYMEQ